jgi:hypothetical protein
LSSNGLRQFDAFVEGTALANVNVAQLAGGTVRQAVTQVVPTTVVSDGFLTIHLHNEDPFLGNPTITGIEVYESGPASPVTAPVAAPASAPVAAPVTMDPPPFTTMRINCGGPLYTDTQGRSWIADQYFTGGSLFALDIAIANTADDILYQTERYGEVTYAIPVPIAAYKVILHFAEIL